MRKNLTAKVGAVTLCLLLVSGSAFAQSSGNFSASYSPIACTINSSNGSFGTTGTSATGGICDVTGGTGPVTCGLLSAGIKTSSGSGVTLVITPAAVTGLYTNTKVSSTTQSATAEVGIQVCVKVDGSGAKVVGGDSNGCAIYDERFQQLSTNLFTVVAACASTTTDLCNIDLILSTLSAHSYNFIAQVPGGQHTVTATWSVVNANTSSSSNASIGACLGPGNVTVTQYKVFQNSGAILSF
jgi:hypothetical protein